MGLRPYLRQSGDEVRGHWHLQERRLLDHLLVGIASGSGDFMVGGERFPVGPGSLVWIPPDTPHEMRATSATMRCLYLHFDLDYDSRRSHWDACIPGGTLDLAPWRGRLAPPVDDPDLSMWRGRLPVRDPEPILTLMGEICLEHRRSGPGQALLLSGKLLQLIAELLHGCAAMPSDNAALLPAPHRERLRQAVDILNRETGRTPDIARVAAQCHLSPTHFRNLFRQAHGVTPRTFHRRARIHRACELLVYSGMNVSEVATELGFSCVHAFSRAFREVAGCSPRQYLTGCTAKSAAYIRQPARG
jgi:AraC-like DNA-binding protein